MKSPSERDWFVTRSGKRFQLLSPDPASICIEDIAHALSMICRFGGHTLRFYSVAQHSVLVSELVPKELALHGLLHDAAEAYVGDVIRPLKELLTPLYQRIERDVEASIAAHFGLAGLSEEQRQLIKNADRDALVSERRDLVHPHSWQWVEDEAGAVARAMRILPLPPEAAHNRFLSRFNELSSRSP